jgi:hypothetical protein
LAKSNFFHNDFIIAIPLYVFYMSMSYLEGAMTLTDQTIFDYSVLSLLFILSMLSLESFCVGMTNLGYNQRVIGIIGTTYIFVLEVLARETNVVSRFSIAGAGIIFI